MVHRAFAEWRRRNFGELANIIDPAFEFESQLAALAGESYRGYAGLEQWTREIDEQFSGVRFALEDVRDVDNQVIYTCVVRGRGRMSGVPVDGRLFVVVTFGNDGRIARMRVYPEEPEALNGLGLET
jgi:ketosteroid isomerase-like protein